MLKRLLSLVLFLVFSVNIYAESFMCHFTIKKGNVYFNTLTQSEHTALIDAYSLDRTNTECPASIIFDGKALDNIAQEMEQENCLYEGLIFGWDKKDRNYIQYYTQLNQTRNKDRNLFGKEGNGLTQMGTYYFEHPELLEISPLSCPKEIF